MRTSGQAFAQSYVELHKVRALQLGLLNPDEIRKMSVAKIENERTYDEKGAPMFHGINDPRMGTMDKELRCFICKGSQSDCPGHFGHIELARPVYHAGLIEYVRKVLRTVCFNCSKILAPKDEVQRAELMKIKKATSRFNRVFKMSDTIKECNSENGGCGHKQPKATNYHAYLLQFTKSGLRIIVDYQDDNYDISRDRKQIFYPEQALKVLEKITDDECELMGFNPIISKPANMIIRNLTVAPPPVRPSVSMSSSMRSEDDLTYAYNKIIQFNNILRTQMAKGANQTTINELRQALQYYVATLMDNEIQGQPTQKHKSGKPLKAIRARLRGKEGRLRGNLMGKRVDFSARTVITPDPNLKLDQLGVPSAIAMNMTVPETVTSENMDEMRKLVNNGPNIWPGAKYIIRHDDKQIDLSSLRNRSDAHLEPGYRVERHLKDDDYVIFNRQPSLHKMSLMGHRVRVLPFSTFRLNLSVTTPYNADFDGDEMNMHVPQSYETMAEIKEIMAVPKQIVTPQKNAPVMGIVQDALLGIMLFTLKDTYVELDILMNILMWINYSGTLPHPAILKPKPLWTGKQIISLIIPDVNYQKFAEKNDNWTSINDKNVLIQRGELLCGVMTKGTVGNAAGGMVHIIWKEHGPDACRDFLSNVQLVINNWLYTNGFTVGVQDIIAKQQTIQKIREKLKKYMRKTQKILQKAQMGELKSQPGKSMMETFEAKVNQSLNKARDESGNLALDDLTSWNRLKAMVFAGSKGSNLNISQIMACVGQQNVEGKRIPFGFKKRTLPHFTKDDFGPESKGFVENCYLNGLTPSEFFFHAMGGREGLIDTAVKTAETGYIQRRLIKALEDVMAKYDGTVRTSKQQVIQFLYGEDGLAGEHIEDLTIELLKQDNAQVAQKHQFLPNNLSTIELEEHLKKSISNDLAREIVQDPNMTFRLQEEYRQILKDRDDLRNIIFDRNLDDAIHIGVNVPRLLWNAKEKFFIKANSKTDLKPDYVLDKVKQLTETIAVIPGVKVRTDALIQEANENSTWLFKIYLRQILSSKNVIQTGRLNRQAFDWLIGEIESRFNQAIVNPGEMVGSIGAQSIGEPATQMTLNTFHNAGISSKNVTLGVPRLKEIINVAKNIKTPSMKIYLKDKFKKDSAIASKIGGQIEHTTLSHVVKNSAIYYDPDPLNTIVSKDVALLQLYNDIAPMSDVPMKLSPWLLRFELDNQKMQFKSLNMQDIANRIEENFKDQVNIMVSDDNAENLVLRIRVNDIEDDEEETVCMYLKEFEDKLLHDLSLKGIHEISKVTFSKYNDYEFDPTSGAFKLTKDNYLIETDGVALGKILGYKKIDRKKTISNDIIEILKILGIEAVRASLINELRFVLGTYGIYVNYRHLAILCDIMTQRGILTSITRHGINRVDTGPLRKCSFEETVEILLEAAVFSEIDPLSGITENIIMGQLAPYGTGCFDLVIDQNLLTEFAQTKNLEENYMPGGNTPIIDDMYNKMVAPNQQNPYYTQYASNTPQYDGMGGMSEYSSAGTPGYMGSFSPHLLQSPNYMSPNPNQSPFQSPGYRVGSMSPAYYQSPIYQVADYPPIQQQQQQNDSYSPTGLQSPAYQPAGYSPAYQNSYTGQTPLYTSGQAPSSMPLASSSNYSPSNIVSQHSVSNYSPTQMNPSPAYSPTAHNNYSPSYSPTSPAYNSAIRHTGTMATPRYQGTQSTVQGQQSVLQSYSLASPAYEPTNYAPSARTSRTVMMKQEEEESKNEESKNGQ